MDDWFPRDLTNLMVFRCLLAADRKPPHVPVLKEDARGTYLELVDAEDCTEGHANHPRTMEQIYSITISKEGAC